MKPIPLKSIVYYASSDPKYTGLVGIIVSGFISPKSEILTQDVKFAFGTFRHEFTHLHQVKQFTDKQKQSLEKLKITYPHLFMENEMRNFQIGDWVTHSDYSIDGTIKGAKSATGHYPVILDNGQEIKAHEDKLTQKNNVTALELAERRMPTIVATIKTFLATDLAQQLSPAQRDAINKPGNYTTWKPLTAALIKTDLERQAMEFINATKEKQVTDTVPTSTAQQPNNLEFSTQPSQENSQATTETSNGAEVVTNNPIFNDEPTPQTRNEETQAGVIHNSLTETQTVIMFKLVVTGRTQADHERLLPKFIEKINSAVDIGLAPAINAGFGYKFEVVKPTYKYLLEVERDCVDDCFSDVVEFDHPATDDDIYAWFKSEDIEFDDKYHRFSYSLIS